MDAIDAFFALADDSNVCIRCGESGHTNCECNTKDDDPVKIALINLRKKLQGEEVDEEPQGEDSKEPEGTYQATGEGEYMFLRPIPLSVISDRAHGELSINGVKIGEKGPATRDALSRLVDIASQKGVTMTCKDVIEAGKYSDHKMYKKLPVKTSIGKLKVLPLNGGKFYSKKLLVQELNFSSQRMRIPTKSSWRHGRKATTTTSTKHYTTSRRQGEGQGEGSPI